MMMLMIGSRSDQRSTLTAAVVCQCHLELSHTHTHTQTHVDREIQTDREQRAQHTGGQTDNTDRLTVYICSVSSLSYSLPPLSLSVAERSRIRLLSHCSGHLCTNIRTFQRSKIIKRYSRTLQILLSRWQDHITRIFFFFGGGGSRVFSSLHFL